MPYGPKTIRKYKRSQVAMHRVGMEDGSRDRPILRRLPISNTSLFGQVLARPFDYSLSSDYSRGAYDSNSYSVIFLYNMYP